MSLATPISLERLCRLAVVSRAGFYRWQHASEAVDRDLDLRDEIQQIALEFLCYGWPRVTRELGDRGWRVNHTRVYRIMREDNLLCLRRRKFVVVTTDSNHNRPVYPNLAREMAPATAVQLNNPSDVAVDNSGNVYVTQGGGSPAVLRVSGGEIDCLPSLEVDNSSGLAAAADGAGNIYWISGTGGAFVYKTSANGVTSLVLGGANFGCSGTELIRPLALTIDPGGNLYVADERCNVIWKVPPSGTPAIVVGTENVAGCANGTANAATLTGPTGIAADPYGDLFIVDTCGVRMLNSANNVSIITTSLMSEGGGPNSIAVGPGGTLFVGLADEIVELTPAVAQMWLPSRGGVLSSSSETFQWGGAPAGSLYSLDISDKPGGAIGQGDIFHEQNVTTTSTLVSNLPCDGRTIYVQLQTVINGQPQTPGLYVYSACQMLHVTVSPTSLPPQGGVLRFTVTVQNYWPSTQTFQLGNEETYQPYCAWETFFGFSHWVCYQYPSYIFGTASASLAAGAAQTCTFTDAVGAIATGASRTLTFDVWANSSTGALLDSIPITVTQN